MEKRSGIGVRFFGARGSRADVQRGCALHRRDGRGKPHRARRKEGALSFQHDFQAALSEKGREVNSLGGFGERGGWGRQGGGGTGGGEAWERGGPEGTGAPRGVNGTDRHPSTREEPRRAARGHRKGSREFDDLTDLWQGQEALMNDNAKRLIVFAPDAPGWNEIAEHWTQALHYASQAGDGLADHEYKTILSTIAESV